MLNQWLGEDAVAQAPARHGVALGEAVEQYGAFLHAWETHDAGVFSGIDDVLVNLVGEDVEVVVFADHLGDGAKLIGVEHCASGVLGRVDDDEAGVLVDVGFEVVQVGVVGLLLKEAHGDGLGAAEADHGLENGEAGVGVNHLVTGVGQG